MLEHKYSGFSAGVQVGYTMYFLEHFGMNAEIGARYQQVKYENKWSAPQEVSQLNVPISLGLRYRL